VVDAQEGQSGGGEDRFVPQIFFSSIGWSTVDDTD